VAINQGPLVSLQSFILGVLGLIAIVVGTSKIAKLLHLVDTPDGHRKQHKGSVPLVGGLVLFVSLLYGNFVFGIETFYQYLLVSLVPILIIGTIDGIKGIIVPISIRIIAQILASWIIILTTDIYVRDLGNLFGTGVIQLNQFGIPFTIFSVVGLCNAFNMLDGRDGLAASVAITIFSGLFLILFTNGFMYNWGLILILSLLVFLAFNLGLLGDHRRIFLGDHGSTSLGHIIGWCLVYLSQETVIITPISVLYFVAVPFLDALLTFVRRIRSSSSIFNGDERHFHHLLSDLGYSNYLILLIITSMSFLAVLVAIGSIYLAISEYILFFIYVTIFVFLVLLGGSKPMRKNQ
jgi:UDP-GlcNAc:undecaprenyl-phosphate/decaprenyl-phosphate GlcNAc-1-phosphate transferase